MKCVTQILHCFFDVSGLKINLSKCSMLGLRVDDKKVKALAHEIKFQPSKLPLSYVGLPVGSNLKKKSSWLGIIDKFNKRLANSKASTLSIGERLTLIKVVLSSLPL